MRQFLKFFIALCVATIIVLAIRVFAFTIYSSPVTIGHTLRSGEKVVVNKLCRSREFQKGELIIFTDSGEAPGYAIIGPPQSLGMVIAVPGDTITVRKQRYRIPYRCCDRCQCQDCKLYLVDTGYAQCLVHKHQVVGKARRLFR